ncbi:MAG: trypsin-like peptidase domain-containing protein [Luteolibacter sp.]|uniref:trypsin-like peptidase domain-containing protein n=1 Tax=Luteolibacter sp. TaxID=1962973 RepID=UPI003264D4B0
MKVKSFFPLAGVCLGLFAGNGILQAAEPVHTLDDLNRLQSKVETVSRKVMPATVALLSEKTESSGSGVITTADGLILTAAHVTQGAEEVTVVFPDGEQVQGKVLGANYSKDIAMVQIQGKGPWPFAEMGESKSLTAGDWVVALGHSAGFDATRTPPVRFGRVVSKGPGNFLTTDCTLIGGDSGGPLFDLNGKIIGINSSIGVSLTNNNHAGIDGFKQDWDRIRAGEAWGQLSMNPFANPEKPVLGIAMGRSRGTEGVPVDAMAPRSPAAAAGLRPGDVITSLDGATVPDANRLEQALTKHQAGDKVKLGILRNRKTIDVDVLLARYDDIFSSMPDGASPQTDEDIPLMLPEERQAITAQDQESGTAIAPELTTAAKSTVGIWAGSRRLAYGTVVGDGTKIVSKWSEVARASGNLRVGNGAGEARAVKLAGVYEDEDLVVLDIEGAALAPVSWSHEAPKLGSFLAAPQPDGRLAGFGVVSVLERNLRDTDLAYLGVVAAKGFAGKGVKIGEIDPGSGAAKAGLLPGNVILKVGDRPISGVLALRNALNGAAPGGKVSLWVEVNGREKAIDVSLGNRPETHQYFGARLQQMERMGGPISQIRDSFSHVIQSDLRVSPNQVGGPVVDLNGRVLGITMARADRTRSFVMPAAAVENLLKKDPANPALAQVREDDEAKPEPANGGPPLPRGRSQRGTEERMRRHLTDMQRLMEYMNDEMQALENR